MRHVTDVILGLETSGFDPKRVVWYSMDCGYWTDDFDRLTSALTCPFCGSVGGIVSHAYWDACAETHESYHPGYLEFIRTYKEFCFGRNGHRPELLSRGFVR